MRALFAPILFVLSLAVMSLAAAGCGTVCSHGPHHHEVGNSYASNDYCNTCSCGEDGEIHCSTRACD